MHSLLALERVREYVQNKDASEEISTYVDSIRVSFLHEDESTGEGNDSEHTQCSHHRCHSLPFHTLAATLENQQHVHNDRIL